MHFLQRSLCGILHTRVVVCTNIWNSDMTYWIWWRLQKEGLKQRENIPLGYWIDVNLCFYIEQTRLPLFKDNIHYNTQKGTWLLGDETRDHWNSPYTAISLKTGLL